MSASSVKTSLISTGGGGDNMITVSSSVKNSSVITPINYKAYLCPGCSSFYDTTRKGIAFVGRNPLILNCNHTVCEECLRKVSIRGNKIVCFVCQELSEIAGIFRDGKFQNVFPLNYYLMGLILCTKHTSEGPMTLSSTGFTLKRKSLASDAATDVTDNCCIVSCRRSATVKCVDCNDFYCSECSVNVHKSVPFLGSHKTEAISNSKFSLELEKCSEHNGMDIEFYCKNCETGACCYCFLEKHEGHERQLMSKLNDAEMLDFNVYKDKAMKVLRQLLVTQKKVKQMHTYDTSEVETKVASYFADLHARLYRIEKKLHDEIANITSGTQDWGLISSNLSSSINHLKQLINIADSTDAKKFNLRALLAKLKECEDIPCFLVNKANKDEGQSFYVDPVLDNLEDYFSLNQSVDNGYILVSSQKLPPDYKYELMDASAESDTDSDISKLLGSSKSDIPSKSSVENIPQEALSSGTNSCSSDRSNIYEEVIVTHIESVENFYVQKKSQQAKFRYLMKDIRNYLKNARLVTNPEINGLYLVEYVTKSSREWCRGRVISFVRSKFCKLFLIDYGNTIEVSKDKLFTINPYLAQKHPFAIRCKLHNPTNSEWSEDAPLHMARIISRKETHMCIKHSSREINEVKLQVQSPSGTMTSVAEMLIMACENTLSDRDDFDLTETQTKIQPVSGGRLFKNNKKFNLNDSVNVIITYVKDPFNIYVQIESYREDYHKMLRLLRTQFKKLNSCIPIKGSFVIVQHKLLIHGDYHRAEVLDVDALNKLCHVFLVDLGSDLHVPWINIKILPENFSKLECQAIKIRLAHVESYGDDWPDSILLDIQKYIISEQVLKMVVKNTEPLEVALFEVQPNVDICINAILVMKKQAKSTGIISKTVEWPQIEVIKEEDPGFMFVKQTKIVSLEESDDDHDNADNDSKGIKQPVDVVNVEGPDLIFIKFHINSDKEKQLYEELQVHYTNEREYKDSWKIGEKCVICDPKDNDYCRGIITEKVDGKYKVYLNDKGNERIVPKEFIFLLNSYFNKYHDMVFKCHLANIEPAGDKKVWSKMAIEYLQHVLKNNKNIYVKKVKKSEGSIPVEMWYSKLVSGTALEPSHTLFKSINKLLVNAGLAFKRKPDANSDTELCDKAGLNVECKINPYIKEETDVSRIEAEELKKDGPQQVKEEDFCKKITTDKDEKVKKKSNIDWNDLIAAEDEEKTNTVQDWPPPFKLTVSDFQAMITCADYDGILYVHDITLDPLYKDMEQKLKEWFDDLPQEKPNNNWLPGQLCTIHYEKKWYRGTVINVKDNGIVNVFMIDFGSDHDCKISQLSPRVMYTDIPPFASKVKLYQVYSKGEIWSEEDYKCLLDNVTETARIVIREGLNSDLPLVDVYIEGDICLNDLLVEKSSTLTRLQTSERYSSSDSFDDVKIIGSEDSQENLSKGELEPVIHTEPSLSYQLIDIPQADDDSGKLKMRIVNVLDFDKVILDVLGNSIEYSELFEAITEDIQASYEGQPALKKIQVGMPCLSPFSEDGNWYRAQIYKTDTLLRGHVLVFYVDYGNFDSVPYADLKEMKPEWLELPVRNQLVHINVKLLDDNLKDIALGHITQLEGKMVSVEIVSREPLTVNIYDETTADLYYQELIENSVLSLK